MSIAPALETNQSAVRHFGIPPTGGALALALSTLTAGLSYLLVPSSLMTVGPLSPPMHVMLHALGKSHCPPTAPTAPTGKPSSAYDLASLTPKNICIHIVLVVIKSGSL